MTDAHIAEPLRRLSMSIADLTPDPANARKHGPRNLDAIKASLAAFGHRKPIVVQAEGMIVRAGNGTLEAAKALGWETIAAVVLDDDNATASQFAIADNRTAELAEWDDKTLASLLDGMDEPTRDMLAFDDKELAGLMRGLEPDEIVEDEAPEPPADPITQPGDLWTLGQHRLLCGDSTKREDVDGLMAGRKADLCFTSPPYALGQSVALSGNTSMSSKGNAYTDHDDNAADWDRLMRQWFAASSHAVRHVWVINVQPLAGNKRDLMRFVADHADRLVDICTWDKGHAAPQMAAGVMASRYEWMVLFAAAADASRAVPLSSWQGTVQSVYAAPAQHSNEFASVHAATMPLHVPAWVMQTLCDQCKTVYEPFAGTGTTLIAAEQLGRTCYGIEISPSYCDVIVQRWENLTGQEAVRNG